MFGINGQPHYKETYVQRLKAECARIGLDPKVIGGHSLRIGGATACALANLSTTQIRMIGRWTSTAYQLYLREKARDRINAIRATIQAAHTHPNHGSCHPGSGPWEDRMALAH